jgi:toxin ParE1/3/4
VAARLSFRPRAEEDLERIYDLIADYAGADSAGRIVGEIRAQCAKLAGYPRVGTPRPRLARGLRTFAFRKAVIAWIVATDGIVIVRIRYGGQRLTRKDFAP